MAKQSGRLGTISIGGTTIHVLGWSVDESVNEVDLSDTGGPDFDSDGIKRGTFSCNGYWNLGAGPEGKGFVPGASVACLFTMNGAGGAEDVDFTGIILSLTVSSSTTAGIAWSGNGRVDGAITWPT